MRRDAEAASGRLLCVLLVCGRSLSAGASGLGHEWNGSRSRQGRGEPGEDQRESTSRGIHLSLRPAGILGPGEDGVRAVLVTVALGLALMALATMPAGASGIESTDCPAHEKEASRQGLLTIKALHIFNKPIRTRCRDLARGPIWDLAFPGRPGDGLTMVIDAHDVTPVPGYGAHGPFYRLYTIKPGQLVKIKYHRVLYVYRFVTYPFAKPQRLKNGHVNNRPIKNWRGEVIYFRCCWPRYTRHEYLYERAVLVSPKP